MTTTEIIAAARDIGGIAVAMAAIAVLRRELHALRAAVEDAVNEMRRARGDGA